MEQNIVLIGFLLIVIGMVVIIIGSIAGSNGEGKVAVGGFIGPIPFGFANDPKMLKIIYGIMGAMIVLFFVIPIIMRYLVK